MKKPLILVAAFLAACSQPQAAKTAAAPPPGCVTRVGNLGGPIALTDSTGAAVTQATYAGKPALLYFGFANCPDVCPVALDLLGETMRAMGAAADELQPIFVSVDPARDTPDVLAAYVATERFPPRLVGLTGPEADIDALSRAYGVGVVRSGEGDSYTVGHASNIYILDGQWRLKGFMPSNAADPQTLAQCIDVALEAP